MPRIVLIEDDAVVREDLRLEFVGAGHEVAAFTGGNSALPTILKGKPDVVVTDIIMEDGEGMDLITKTIEECPGAKLIAISSSREYLRYALALGAHDALLKPFKLAQILEVVEAQVTATAK